LTRDKAGEPYKIGDARFGAWPFDSMQILRVTSVFLIVIAMMLLGADVVSSLEQTGGMVVRSFNHILMLCGFDAGCGLRRISRHNSRTSASASFLGPVGP